MKSFSYIGILLLVLYGCCGNHYKAQVVTQNKIITIICNFEARSDFIDFTLVLVPMNTSECINFFMETNYGFNITVVGINETFHEKIVIPIEINCIYHFNEVWISEQMTENLICNSQMPQKYLNITIDNFVQKNEKKNI